MSNEFIARNGLKALADSSVLGGLSATTLFLSATTNPARIQGLSAGTDTLYLTIDNNGVMHTGSGISGVTIADMSALLLSKNSAYTTTTSFVDVTFENNDLLNNSAVINHSTSVSPERITVGESGLYQISYNGNMKATFSGTPSTDIAIQLFKNGTTLVTDSYNYAMNSSGDVEAISNSIVALLNANDYFTLQAKFLTNQSTLSDLNLSVIRLKGTKGDTGASGTGGTGGVTAVTLSQNVLSVSTTATTNTTINAATGGTYNTATGIITLAGTGVLTTITGVTLTGGTLKFYAEFSGTPTSSPTATGSKSIAMGDGARAGAADMFVYGQNAGSTGTSSTKSIFIGFQAGSGVTNAATAVFVGSQAGQGATGATNSVFIGNSAGLRASAATTSIFIGQGAGQSAGNATNSTFIGQNAGFSAITSTFANFLGVSAGQNATAASFSNFIGWDAGMNAPNASNSNFIGPFAGQYATGATNANFIGQNAGYSATSASFSNFIGYQAGQYATAATYSNFFGNLAGNNAINVGNSNFLGTSAGDGATGVTFSNFFNAYAGYQATDATNSNFFGNQAGYQAAAASDSNFFGNNAGYQATGVTYSNFFGYQVGYQAAAASYSNFFGSQAGYSATSANNSNFFGQQAGFQATGASYSNFFGYSAGAGATDASGSNFFGNNAGNGATNASGSNFFGLNAGNGAFNANDSHFFGNQAGYQATNANNSNFMGYWAGLGATIAAFSNFFGNQAGYQATAATYSNFFGQAAGYQATNATSSNFFGNNAGYIQSAASYSNLFGYQVGKVTDGNGPLGSNNIIIGTNITLPSGTTNAINIGGVLFGKNTYGTTGGNPTFIPLTTGQIGINVVPSAITNTLHVSATTNPLRVHGLTASTTDTNLISIDASGVMHTYAASLLTGGSSSNIYTTNGTLQGNRVVNLSSNTLTFSSSTANRSTLFLSGNSVAIGTTTFDSISPEAFAISAVNTTSYNILTADANVNNYTQFNLTNYSSGSSASADMIVTNNIGTETTYYTDMGINSSNFSTGIVGFANDGYVYHQGSNFWIGNTTTGTGVGNVYIFAGNSGGTIPDITVSGTNGYVGIQTPTPIYNLDISGHTRSTNGYLVTSAFTGPYSDGLVMDYVNTGGRIYVGANDSISFYTNYPASAATLTITSGGSVGIGVSGNNITNTLHVSATTNPVRIQGLSAASDTLYLTVDANGVMHTGAAGGGFSWTMNTGLTATGTNQATALPLTKKLNDVATTASGTGVVLPSATVNDFIQVTNHGNFPLFVYPAVGESVEGLTQNVPLTLLEGQSFKAGCPTAGFWVGIEINVYDDENTSINLPVSTISPPQTPVTGARIFVSNVGGRKMPSGIGPSGVDFPFQPHTGRSRPAWWQPLGNATTVPITTGFAAPTTMGTATARNVATTNIATRMKRLGYVSTATSGSVTGHFFLAASQQYTLGTGPTAGNLGGFHYICRFVVSDAALVTAATSFIGWRTVVTQPTSGNPATQLNQFGLAQISGDPTQWYFLASGGVAQTPVPLGTALGAPTATTTAWDLAIFSPPSISGNVQYTVTNLGTNATTGGSITITGTTAANLPVSTVLLAPVAWRSPGIQALAVGLDICTLYIETDY